MTKPNFLQSLENHLGIELQPGPPPELLVRHDYAGQYVLDSETGNLLGLNLVGCNKLEKLDLDENYQHLQVLNVGQSGLKKLQIPPELKHLRELRAYECKNLNSVELPDTLEQLHYLDLSNCAISVFTVPKGLERLQKLYLQKNKLQALNWAETCPALLFADLSQNELSHLELPDALKSLRYLYLNDNKLQKLQCTGTLPALQVLHLRNNQLNELPLVFLQGKTMETLYLHNNPLSTIPSELIAKDERDNSLKEVRDYLLELDKNNNIINDRAKLIIVGNGRVGKTSLFKQLKGEVFNPDEAYTHGVQIGTLTKADLPDVAAPSLKLNVWDFGGQEIFYATHQFFLSDEAIYLLAWTNEKNVEAYRQKSDLPPDEKWRSEDYWLDNIRSHGPTSPILMVQTHSDRWTNKLLPDAAYQEAPYQVEFIDFSASRGEGVLGLKDFIQTKLQSAVPMFGQTFPKSYERVIERMENATENMISMADFEKICAECDITAGTESTVLSYLYKSGVVVYCEREGLKEVVFTNPNWLTQQVYRLINNELVTRAGRIDPSYLEKNLPEYSPEIHTRFIGLLKTFKLIFAAEGEAQVFIAPQYLPRVLESDKRNLYESHKDDLELAFVFRFPRFMPENVMVNFLSTYGPYSRKEYWRDCIFFRKNKQKCIVDFDDETNTLRVYTGKEPEALDLQVEVCEAFVALSKNARAEISLDGHVFASWQELQREFSLYEKHPGQRFFAIDQKTPLYVREFVRFFDHGKTGQTLYSKEKEQKSQVNPQHMPSIKTLIKQAKYKEALDVLEDLVPDYFKNDVILQYSRLTNLGKQIHDGVISTENAGIETARIRAAILSILETSGIKDLPDEESKTSTVTNSPIGRDTGSFSTEEPESIEIPDIEPFEESLIVPKGADGLTKILFLTADPTDKQQLRVNEEATKVKVASQGKALNIEICPHIDRGSMIDTVAFEKPQIVHFSGHGSEGGLVMFDADTNLTVQVSTEDLKRMFAKFKKVGVKCVVLCSCWSFYQAKAISELDIPVVGMLRKIADEDAIRFSRNLYHLLVSENPLEVIFDLAKEKASKASQGIPSLWYKGKRIA